MIISPDPKQLNSQNKKVKKDEQERKAASWRTTVNLVVAIVCILLFAGGYFLINSMDKMKKAQICLESGNKACQRIEPTH